MDALSIIQALDFIKNEEVYTARLAAIQAEQKKLENVQDICKTVDDAKEYFLRAEKVKEQADDKAAKVKQEADEYYKSKMAEVEARLVELQEKTVFLTGLEQGLRDAQSQVRIKEGQLVRDRELLTQQTLDVQKHLEESNQVRTLYNVKLNELKRIVNV